jgi:tRNA 2-selenouridine synthase
MPASPHTHALPVHPHQLEVQEFDTYDLIADLRAAEAFDRDHIPRAVSAPWVHGGKAIAEGATLAATEPALTIPYALEAHLASLAPGSSIVLYCDQGGAVSAGVGRLLAPRGFAVDVLPGGWDSYRRWVTAGIEILARTLDWRWVRSGPGGASQVVVEALAARGEQVFEVGALFDSALVPGLLPDPARTVAPSIESRIVDGLRRVDPAARVLVDEVIFASGTQVLPTPLHEALRHADAWRIEASHDCRVDLLQRWFGQSGATVASLVDSLAPYLPGTRGSTIDRVRDRLSKGSAREALATLLRDVLDPLHASFAVLSAEGRERPVVLPSASAADVDRLAEQLTTPQIKP